LFLLILQVWKFIVDSNYENIFETKTPIFILTGVIVIIALVNITISIANVRSFSGSFVTDLKDNALKYLGLDFLSSDSTKQNPLDELVSSMDKIQVE
jgi:ABC-type xylose transport system permease subunit